MSHHETQRAAYEESTQIKSDALGLLDRDNRNHRKKLDLILETIPDPHTAKLLEVGCGSGLHAERYAAAVAAYRGIDLSPALVDTTTRRLADSPAATAQQMDATCLLYPTDEFDAVVGTAVLHHMADPVGALREWLRVTGPSGGLTLMEPNYLFPKDLIETHLVPEEAHKIQMRPWRLTRILAEATAGTDRNYSLDPCIYTLPWPQTLHGLYDWLDDACQRIPVLRWCAQMQRIHIAPVDR